MPPHHLSIYYFVCIYELIFAEIYLARTPQRENLRFSSLVLNSSSFLLIYSSYCSSYQKEPVSLYIKTVRDRYPYRHFKKPLAIFFTYVITNSIEPTTPLVYYAQPGGTFNFGVSFNTIFQLQKQR